MHITLQSREAKKLKNITKNVSNDHLQKSLF